MTRNDQKRVTIVDIAREAGVSIKTVSRVLNREEGASAEVRSRVETVIEKMGYRPNASARSLSSRRSYLIGVIFQRLGGYHYVGEVQTGALRATRRGGYQLVVEQVETPDGVFDAEAVTAILRNTTFDGLVLTPPLCDDPRILEAVEAADLAYVRMAPNADLDRAPYVWMDDEGAAREQTLSLWEMGHRRIAFVAGPEDHRAAIQRRQGYLRAMAERGVAVPDAWIASGDFFGMSGFKAGDALLSLPEPPTAIFAGNDEMAIGVLAAAAKHGVPVPDRLSVVGFDNAPNGASAWPPLTTVHQPIAEMAEAAVDLLIKRFGDARFREQEHSRKLDYRLVVRDSVSPV
ncbi:LacI family DNA-binding transcriptional regulator [Caulobacter sp. RL271]|uniref:LacI family DNA-binding transcriptional regulator n=1 Tax=Caulobacter segnis TaxID=88688 RepID=A0ABY4ZZU2_9CAUL|nr:LacI family DNA-binding transcriptional regulator [Caulobacter segnis]USQ98066.1 LacI family DNA-binding transcriptional regulator [Caulobacter segnis]